MKTKLSRPRLNCAASARRLSGFGCPIDLPTGEVFAAQRHFGSLLEDSHHIRFVVLAAKRDENARLGLPDHEFLKARNGGEISTPAAPSSPHCPCQSVLSQSSAMTLTGGRAKTVQGAKQSGPNRGVTLRRVRDVAELVGVRIMKAAHWIARQDRLAN